MRINAINTMNRKQISFKGNNKEMPMTAHNKGITQFERNIAAEVAAKSVKKSNPLKTFFGKVNKFLNKNFNTNQDMAGMSFEELAFLSISRL